MMDIDRGFLIQACQDLVRINSVNPVLVPGAPGERAIADHTARVFGQLGLQVERHEPDPGRISVTGRLPGTGGGRSLMLNAHYDTVGVEGMTDPFSAAVADGRLYGRGAYDMKGSLAAMMAAVEALRRAGVRLRGDLVLAAVADEEYGSLGTADLVTRIRTDAAIVTEPTSCAVCLAHKGYEWIEIRTEGRAAHGSRFSEGIDANIRMGRFLSGLDRLEQELRHRTPHPLVGPPSLHAATLSGGTGLSTYAASCTLQVERRTVPGETSAQALSEIQAILDRLTAEDPSFRGSARTFFSRDPFEVDREAPVVRSLAGALHLVTAGPPAFVGDTPWMDSALLSGAGIETVVFGPGGGGAHADVEWVEIDSMVRCAAVLAETAVAYCA